MNDQQSTTMSPEDFFKSLKKKSSDTVFLLGNGINRYMKSSVSWNELLKRAVKKAELLLPEEIEEALDQSEADPSLNFPEIFSLFENIQRKEEKDNCNAHVYLKKACADILSSPQPLKSSLLDYAKYHKKDIITLNFEFAIEDYLGISHPRNNRNQNNNGIPKQSFYNYLFECFGSLNTARVWHIHGHCNIPQTIRLSLEDYICTFNYIKEHLFVTEDGKQHHNPIDDGNWIGAGSCIEKFFHNRLIIAGCSLKSEEVLLRALLLYKYRSQVTRRVDEETSGYYLTVKADNKADKKDKYTFLKMLNFKIVEFNSYDDLYNSEKWSELCK